MHLQSEDQHKCSCFLSGVVILFLIYPSHGTYSALRGPLCDFLSLETSSSWSMLHEDFESFDFVLYLFDELLCCELLVLCGVCEVISILLYFLEDNLRRRSLLGCEFSCDNIDFGSLAFCNLNILVCNHFWEISYMAIELLTHST